MFSADLLNIGFLRFLRGLGVRHLAVSRVCDGNRDDNASADNEGFQCVVHDMFLPFGYT